MSSSNADMTTELHRIAQDERRPDMWAFTRVNHSDRVLDALRQFWQKRGHGPTVKELAFNVGLTTSQTRTALLDLREWGSVTWDYGVPGSLREVLDPTEEGAS